MAIEAVMLDVDGVVVVHPDARGWSVDLERDLGFPPALLQEVFFKPHWDDVLHGRASLHERLAPVLAEIAPGIECAALIDYWFAADAHLNEALLTEVALLRAAGMPVHLATLQEHERARYLWETLGLHTRFDGLHCSAELGAAKPHPLFYAAIEARTGLPPESLFFVDDRQHNVDAALGRGWNAALWRGETGLRDLMAQQGAKPR